MIPRAKVVSLLFSCFPNIAAMHQNSLLWVEIVTRVFLKSTRENSGKIQRILICSPINSENPVTRHLGLKLPNVFPLLLYVAYSEKLTGKSAAQQLKKRLQF